MIVLDTDHYSELLDRRSIAGARLEEKLANQNELVAVSIITIEEVMRGWLAFIHRYPDPHSQLPGYDRLAQFLDSLSVWTILRWQEEEAELFQDLRSQKLRLGSMDLKIAATCLVHDALLLTRNLRDFEVVPGLRIENWLN